MHAVVIKAILKTGEEKLKIRYTPESCLFMPTASQKGDGS